MLTFRLRGRAPGSELAPVALLPTSVSFLAPLKQSERLTIDPVEAI